MEGVVAFYGRDMQAAASSLAAGRDKIERLLRVPDALLVALQEMGEGGEMALQEMGGGGEGNMHERARGEGEEQQVCRITWTPA